MLSLIKGTSTHLEIGQNGKQIVFCFFLTGYKKCISNKYRIEAPSGVASIVSKRKFYQSHLAYARGCVLDNLFRLLTSPCVSFFCPSD